METLQVKQRLQKEMMERNQIETQLKEVEIELQQKGSDLEEANATIILLLRKLRDSQKELEAHVANNINEIIIPYIENLKRGHLDRLQQQNLSMVEVNLKKIFWPFSLKLTRLLKNLTPAEIKVVNMIREGKTSKEIAMVLGLSSRTIDTHRVKIRKKIGLLNRKVDLRSYLLSFE